MLLIKDEYRKKNTIKLNITIKSVIKIKVHVIVSG